MRKLEQEVSITHYSSDYPDSDGIGIEQALKTGRCEYKSVYDDPPDSSEKCIGSVAYMKNSDYEAGINQFMELGSCKIQMYKDESFIEKCGELAIENKEQRTYINGVHTDLKIEDLLGVKCPPRQVYYNS